MQDDEVIYRRELRERLRVSGETIRELESLPRWKLEHIAAFLDYSIRHVRDTVAHLPDFPRPIINRGNRRFWSPEDVKAWAARA